MTWLWWTFIGLMILLVIVATIKGKKLYHECVEEEQQEKYVNNYRPAYPVQELFEWIKQHGDIRGTYGKECSFEYRGKKYTLASTGDIVRKYRYCELAHEGGENLLCWLTLEEKVWLHNQVKYVADKRWQEEHQRRLAEKKRKEDIARKEQGEWLEDNLGN